MSPRGRSPSPRPLDGDVNMEDGSDRGKRVVIVANLTRNVVESHLQTIFGQYGELTKVDLPVFGKCVLRPLPLTIIFVDWMFSCQRVKTEEKQHWNSPRPLRRRRLRHI